MILSEIYSHLDTLSPFLLQESWDNSGLQIGDKTAEIKNVVLSLDIDEELLETVEENSLIITHHPLIFKGIKSIEYSSYPSSLIRTMVKKNISNIAMHTNFDKTHLNNFVASEILGFKITKSEEYIAYFDVNMSFDKLCEHVKKRLHLQNLRVVKTQEFIKTAALTTGSGGDFIASIDAECFLTGDMKYHQALSAKMDKIAILDIGHYESECHFTEALEPHLKNLPLKVIMSNSKNPFEYK